jgi:hypothetical protein
MALHISSQILEANGFKPVVATEKIVAQFHRLQVYAVRGCVLKESSLPIQTGSVAGKDFRLSLGADVNEICRTLIGHTYIDNVADWQNYNKCNPPYLVVHLGPTILHNFSGTHRKVDGDTLLTIDSFPKARIELRNWTEDVMPALLTGLSSGFSTHEPEVTFAPVDHVVFGITSENKIVKDIRFSLSGTLSVSANMTAEHAVKYVDLAVDVAKRQSPNVASFFHLGLHHDNLTLRFLFFFIAIEMKTHEQFKTFDHSKRSSDLASPQSRVQNTAQLLNNEHKENWNKLGGHFMWCALCIWLHINDDDVKEFMRLKKIRDDIAHGNIQAPYSEEVIAVEKLAKKLLLQI